MEKRHKHVSPTLDIMAKKIFSLPEVTVAFIRDILDLDVVDAQILEGTQLHKKDFDEDELFSTSVDVRAKLNDETEVIIEIQVRKQHYFLNRFHYYLANQLVENRELPGPDSRKVSAGCRKEPGSFSGKR